jgi:hypothetical protein
MGLSSAISGGIVMMMMVIVLVMAIPPVINANMASSRAYSERTQLDGEMARTSIRINSTQSLPPSQSISLTLENDGNVKLWNFDKFTILVTYDYEPSPGQSETVTEALSYGGMTDSPAAGQWGISGFVEDGLDPQILNPEESMIIICKLSNDLYVTGSFTTVIATDNGVSSARTGGII